MKFSSGENAAAPPVLFCTGIAAHPDKPSAWNSHKMWIFKLELFWGVTEQLQFLPEAEALLGAQRVTALPPPQVLLAGEGWWNKLLFPGHSPVIAACWLPPANPAELGLLLPLENPHFVQAAKASFSTRQLLCWEKNHFL